MEANLVARQNIPFRTISAAGVHGVGLRSLPGNMVKLTRGYFESKKILREFQPDVLLFTGGYVAVPMALAGRKIPTLLYVPDIEPGMALKALARYADTIALSAEESKPFFSAKKRVVVTGYPVRQGLQRMDQKLARKALGINEKLPVLLIVGGSKGARLINRAVMALLPDLLKEFQLIHVTGELDWNDIQNQASCLPEDLKARYHSFPYLHEEMAAAFSSADIVLSRAGASTLGELPFYGIPAILVPYPFAWRYQKVNADYLANHGAAIIIENSLLQEKLLSALHDMVRSTENFGLMKKAMTSLSQPSAAASLASEVLNLASSSTPERKISQ